MAGGEGWPQDPQEVGRVRGGLMRLRTDAITKIIKSFSVGVAESLFLDR